MKSSKIYSREFFRYALTTSATVAADVISRKFLHFRYNGQRQFLDAVVDVRIRVGVAERLHQHRFFGVVQYGNPSGDEEGIFLEKIRNNFFLRESLPIFFRNSKIQKKFRYRLFGVIQHGTLSEDEVDIQR